MLLDNYSCLQEILNIWSKYEETGFLMDCLKFSERINQSHDGDQYEMVTTRSLSTIWLYTNESAKIWRKVPLKLWTKYGNTKRHDEWGDNRNRKWGTFKRTEKYIDVKYSKIN